MFYHFRFFSSSLDIKILKINRINIEKKKQYLLKKKCNKKFSTRSEAPRKNNNNKERINYFLVGPKSQLLNSDYFLFLFIPEGSCVSVCVCVCVACFH